MATEVAVQEPAPEAGGLAALGINGSALAFQLLNFAIVLFVLHRYAYKPMLNVLAERRRRIEEGLKTAQEMTRQRQQLAQEQQVTLQEARQAAREIVTAAEQAAGRLTAEAAAQSRAAGEQLMNQTKAKLEHDIAQAKAGLQSELLSLVAEAASKVAQEKIDPKADAALIRQALEAARSEQT